MQFKISDDKTVSMADIKETCEANTDKTYYFTSDTKEENLKKLTQAVEKLNRSIYIKKINFSLENEDFAYSVHIV